MLSSESIYGHQPEVPIHENTAVPHTQNIYGATKLAQETLAMSYYKGYGIKTTVLRSATMFGPYGRMEQAIPIFIKQALMNDDITLEGDGIVRERCLIYVVVRRIV
jgi:UDP-glucuronate 4-epimerase